MSSAIGRAVLVLSGLGFPATQLVIRRFGKPGAAVVCGVCGALLIRDGAMIATRVPGRLRRVPAALLWLEATAAGAAVLTNVRLLADADALQRAAGRGVPGPPDPFELARRTAVGALFGLHSWQFRIYLQPDSWLKPGGDHPAGRPSDAPVEVDAKWRSS